MIKDLDKMVQIKPFLADSAPIDGLRLSNIEDVRNKTLGRNIVKGEPILARDFSEQGSLFLPAPPGHRAVTIRVTLESGLAGFALPGAHVDLVCTRPNPANQNQTLADTFMENVLVLAVNTLRTNDTSQDQKMGVIPTPSVVTLAAKPIDAARIIWAKEKGHINLTLRRPGELEESNVPTVKELDPVDDNTNRRRTRNQMVKVWVARENVFPGQIDKPEQLFRLEEVPPTLAEEAIKGPNPPPVGRLYSVVAKGMPVTLLHYKVAGGAEDPTPKEKPTIMVVQVGGKDPQYYRFTPDGRPMDDGKPVDGPGAAPQVAGSEGTGDNK